MKKIVMVRDKGEITIPKKIRDKWDIKHGTHFVVEELENGDFKLIRLNLPE